MFGVAKENVCDLVFIGLRQDGRMPETLGLLESMLSLVNVQIDREGSGRDHEVFQNT